MDSIAENKMMCKVKSCAKKLCSMKVKDDLDFTVSLTADEDGAHESTCFEKRITSKTEFSLMKALSALMIAGVCIWALCFLCSLCSVLKKK